MSSVDLPDPAVLERLCRALALLDAIVCPEWELRYYAFNRVWDADAGQRLGSMRDGQGDAWFIVFQPEGALLRGFSIDARPRRRPGVFDGVPVALLPHVTEPAFGDDTTFACWNTGAGWQRGSASEEPDGSAELLAAFVDGPLGYVRWAAEYHERVLPLHPVQRIFQGEPITAELVAELAPERVFADLADDLEEIGWPVTR